MRHASAEQVGQLSLAVLCARRVEPLFVASTRPLNAADFINYGWPMFADRQACVGTDPVVVAEALGKRRYPYEIHAESFKRRHLGVAIPYSSFRKSVMFGTPRRNPSLKAVNCRTASGSW